MINSPSGSVFFSYTVSGHGNQAVFDEQDEQKGKTAARQKIFTGVDNSQATREKSRPSSTPILPKFSRFFRRNGYCFPSASVL
jgi:hypothetical protein